MEREKILFHKSDIALQLYMPSLYSVWISHSEGSTQIARIAWKEVFFLSYFTLCKLRTCRATWPCRSWVKLKEQIFSSVNACIQSCRQFWVSFDRLSKKTKALSLERPVSVKFFQNVVFSVVNRKSIDLNCIHVQAGVKGMNVSKPWLMKPALAGIPGGCKISLVMIYISLIVN